MAGNRSTNEGVDIPIFENPLGNNHLGKNSRYAALFVEGEGDVAPIEGTKILEDYTRGGGGGKGRDHAMASTSNQIGKRPNVLSRRKNPAEGR